ncbi:CK1 family protein kinase [Histomonas meleagridis]|uniref:CK1 family protein kinase n=1 Tax=Histomonas meleagridis TaxID=135588 RepID=UPI00355938C3|nr:CK1 family protein kinase [Histomonas meleagridis]KAH0796538.1 CK1 family protein kinase [Histomonas meleagridis]
MSLVGTSQIQPFDIINNYRVIKMIANGGFGSVFFVRENGSNQPFAMKIEKTNRRTSQFDIEYSVLRQIQGSLYFPKLYSHGSFHQNNYIVMELLGPSLSRLMSSLPNNRYSISTTLRLGMEMVCMLREFHSRGFVHRDIKPSNFLVRYKNPTPLCLIDFGLAKRFINPSTGKPHQQNTVSCFIGTAKYSSLNAHKKVDLGPRDDMISWFHTMIEMLNGELPWNNAHDKEGIMKMKEAISPAELTKNAPKEFENIILSLLQLNYEDLPDYDMILLELSQALRDIGKESSDPYDWEKLSEIEINSIFQYPCSRRPSDVYDYSNTQIRTPKYFVKEENKETFLLANEDDDSFFGNDPKCCFDCCNID